MGAGIIYPNIAGTLAPLMQLEQGERRNALAEKAYAREEEDRAREQEALKHLPGAFAGDKDAFGKVVAGAPRHASAIIAHLDRADTATRAKAKEAADLTSKYAMGVLSVPPEQRPQAYAMALADLKARGHNISLPPQYGPDVEAKLNFYVGQARDVNKWHEENANRPTPMGPGGGNLAPEKKAIASIEGDYNSVGPVTKGPNGQPARGYGKYQVMDFNIGPWTQEVLGMAMTPEQYLADDKAQDRVFEVKFEQYKKQYGSSEAAARAWFAGPGGMNNPNAKDVLGTTVADYSRKFTAGMPAPQLAQGSDMRGGDASGTPVAPQGSAAGDVRTLKQFVNDKIPGARVMGVKGVPIQDKQGRYQIMLPDGSTDFIDMPKKEAGTGPFAGNGMDQQAMNILLTGNQDSPEYALAYAHMSKARTTVDEQGRPVTIQPMDLSSVRKPRSQQLSPPQLPEGSTQTPLAGGGTATVGQPVAPKGPSPAEMAKLRAARTEVQKITEAAERFRSEWKKASPMEKSRAMLGGTTPLNSAYNNFALLLKGESGYNLGVLNGPDLEIIRRAIPDPSTLRGNVATMDTDMDSAVDQVNTMLRGGIEAQEKELAALGGPSKAADAPTVNVNIEIIPPPARDRLKANPAEAAQFDEIFGKGAAAKVLGR